MTLTELRYVVALAQERHFGKAAKKCFVTQPTLSLALAKLEAELGVQLFERNKSEVLVTSMGEEIVAQARRVLDEAAKIPLLAKGMLVTLKHVIRPAITVNYPEQQREVADWLASRLFEETPEMLAAIDEADRSLAEEGGVPVEEVRRNMRRWITG